jgi:hypothetical protein
MTEDTSPTPFVDEVRNGTRLRRYRSSAHLAAAQRRTEPEAAIAERSTARQAVGG